MNIKPVIFNSEMIRALMEGRKTQTRRPIKPQPPKESTLHRYYGDESPRPALKNTFGWFMPAAGDLWPCNDDDRISCPFGKVGDLLYVRETWGVADKWIHDCETNPPRTIAYKADQEIRNFDPPYIVDTEPWGWSHMKWRPSIHMPRWASRLTLRITDVRVERVQDITEDDAKAEGIINCSTDLCDSSTGYYDYENQTCYVRFPSQSFSTLWNSIYNNWDQNPWVWVIKFEVIKQNVDEYMANKND